MALKGISYNDQTARPEVVEAGEVMEVAGSIEIAQDLRITGDLFVAGAQSVIEADTVLFKDTLLELGLESYVDANGDDALRAPTANAGKDLGHLFHTFKTGSGAQKHAFFYDENAGRFKIEMDVTETNGVLSGGSGAELVVDKLIGTASFADLLTNSRAISLAGDVAGTANFNGGSDITINATIQPNSVALGADTTGDYVGDVATTDPHLQVTIQVGSGADGDNEGGTHIIQSDATNANTASTIVARDASGNFSAGVITADLAGNASSASALANAQNFSASGDVAAAAVSFDGTGAVNLAMVIQAQAVEFGMMDAAAVVDATETLFANTTNDVAFPTARAVAEAIGGLTFKYSDGVNSDSIALTDFGTKQLLFTSLAAPLSIAVDAASDELEFDIDIETDLSVSAQTGYLADAAAIKSYVDASAADVDLTVEDQNGDQSVINLATGTLSIVGVANQTKTVVSNGEFEISLADDVHLAGYLKAEYIISKPGLASTSALALGDIVSAGLGKATNNSPAKPIGMSAKAITSGNDIELFQNGQVVPFANSASQGDTLYLDATGAVVTSVPTSGDIVQVGYALSSTMIYLDLKHIMTL